MNPETVVAAHGQSLEPIAIVGIGCRLPGGVSDPASYWRMLCEGVDAIIDVPRDRWDLKSYYDPDPNKPGKLFIRQGGFLQGNIDTFDASFFRMSPREAARLDPQQRLLLEVTWEALEDAGIPLEKLAGSDTGVFIGGFTADSLVLQSSAHNRNQIDTHTATGVGFTMLAARLSYTFDLKGPSQTIDTACSSSLVAMHHACQSIWSGECSAAIVGGVNVILSPEFVVVMCKGGFLSPDARCKAFDARANGYARGEGAAALMLKPLSRAKADGDAIYAVVRGTACNQDGFSNGITVPSETAQKALLKRAYARANVAPEHVAYVEAHGTGTPVGDPIEARAIGAVLGAGRPADSPCVIGSVKTNIGHLEAASGVAALTKAALILKHRHIPAHLHFVTPNPAIPFAELGLAVAQTARSLAPRGPRAVVGVNSFGYGGTNAHVVLEEAPDDASRSTPAYAESSPRIFVLSARTEPALRESAARWLSTTATEVEATAEALADLSYNSAARRTHLEERAAIIARTKDELIEVLESLREGEPHPSLSRGAPGDQARSRLAFVYTGMGPQWWAMGRELLAREPVFRAEIEACDAEFRRIGDLSVIEEMSRAEADSRMARTLIAQTTNFALQIGLTALYRSWGVVPEAVVGHSVGEVSAAYAAGVLSREEAILVSYHRARLQAETAGRGGMLAVGLPASETEALIERWQEAVSIAAINAPDAVTIAGEHAALAEIAEILRERQVFHRKLHVEVAYHSPQMKPLEKELLAALALLAPKAPLIPLYSTVTGQRVEDASWGAPYWFRNVREPVRFADAIDTIVTDGYSTFVEVGPHPVLAGSIKSSLSRLRHSGHVVPSLHRERPEQVTVLSALGALHVLGVPVNLAALHRERRRFVPLPKYPFQRERYWSESAASLQERLSTEALALPGRPLHGPEPQWEREINAQYLPWLPDHVVDGEAVFPAAGYIASALMAARSTLGIENIALEHMVLHRALLVGHEEPLLRTSIMKDLRRFALYSRPRVDHDAVWTLNMDGSFAPAEIFDRAPPLDRAAVSARCTLSLPRAEVYHKLKQRGLEYRTAFQAIESLHLGEKEVFAELTARVDIGDEPLHPTLLDACFHALLAALPLDQDAPSEAFVPVTIERLVLCAPCSARATAWGRIRSIGDTTLDADIVLFDDAGMPVAEVRGLHCQRLPSTKGEAIGAAGSLYQEQWHPAPQPASPPENGAEGTWLVLGAADSLAEALIGEIEARGGRARLVTSANAGSSTAQNLQRIMQEFGAHESSCRAVIDLDALGDSQAKDQAEAALRQASRVLKVMQALRRIRWKQTPRLWLVTRGVHDVGVPSEIPPLPALAPLWGLGRVLANEHSELRPSMIDLDSVGKLELDVAALLAEILSDGAETEIAWRGQDRFGRRLARLDPTALGRQSKTLDAEPVVLDPAPPGRAEAVLFREDARRPPGEGEVEIRVQAAAIGGHDGRILQRRARTHEPLGLECTGTVIACGPGVTHVSVGDAVMAIAPGCMRTHLLAKAALVVRRPAGVSTTMAAAPLSLAAAHHAIDALRLMGPEPWVLVHGADSIGGRATVHLARERGARVLFTADDSATVEALERIGAAHVGPTETLKFIDQVIERTGGRGVDLSVRWSAHATGARITSLLAEGAWLVDLASAESVPIAEGAASRGNIVIERCDLAVILRTHPERIAAWLAVATEALSRQALGPREAIEIGTGSVSRTLAELQQSATLTPAVVSFEQGVVTVSPPREGPALSSEATYLVIGGLRGFGLATARWLVKRGARRLVLVSRSGQPSTSGARVLARLRAAGVSIDAVATDVSNQAEVSALVERIQREGPALRGVIHAATVYDDELLQRLDAERLHAVMGPKVQGAWALHHATQHLQLDFFLLYSSASSVLGFQGQASYAAGNLFLDALAEHRRALGLPAESVAWGAIDSGFVARNVEVARRLKQQGVDTLDLDSAFDALGLVMWARMSRCTVMRLRWQQWARIYPYTAASPRFETQIAPNESDPSAGASLRETLQHANPDERIALLTEVLREHAAVIFGLAPSRLDPARPLSAMGLDSLTATEMKNRIDRSLAINVPVLRLLEGQSIANLARMVTDLLESPTPGDRPLAVADA